MHSPRNSPVAVGTRLLATGWFLVPVAPTLPCPQRPVLGRRPGQLRRGAGRRAAPRPDRFHRNLCPEGPSGWFFLGFDRTETLCQLEGPMAFNPSNISLHKTIVSVRQRGSTPFHLMINGCLIRFISLPFDSSRYPLAFSSTPNPRRPPPCVLRPRFYTDPPPPPPASVTEGRGGRAVAKFYYEATLMDDGLARLGWSTLEASHELGVDRLVRPLGWRVTQIPLPIPP